LKFARYRRDGGISLGEVHADHVRDLLDEPDSEGPDLFVRHLRGESRPGTERALGTVALLAPIARPGKVLCIGLNYLDHCREQRVDPPPAPILFAKFSNAIAGPGDAITFSNSDTQRVDWEVELVAIVGRRCRRVRIEEALGCVAGYTVGNDVSARDVQFEPGGQWVRGKTFDGFLPLGPVIADETEIPDPQSLRLEARISGETMQLSNTSEMIFPVAALVSYLSTTMTLEPGDIICTGTPWGVGTFRTPPRFLVDGDVCRLEVEGIGVLENPVIVDGAGSGRASDRHTLGSMRQGRGSE